ncbi:putative membrane protein (TIGR04086 family) [Scopulibacillus darangshiensis]|uniref:Putative membrane protein (TIGR04086 family) n=1 Tax=Scopulibacillus darangshiensis TaxID=442528 RepID=A0A4R2PDS7_9BACL|nr:TIGR04086 family membrane protein [Scopulibacillus darangshiensis]TCP32261.1 putative membrane protein (TIGR04086 family) [Scopulibacillus darangshiensis]
MTRRLFTAACYGMITSFIIIIISALVLATLLKLTTISESSVNLMPTIISFTALFIGGLIAGVKMKEKGLMIGAVTGILYCFLIFAVKFLGFDNSGSSQQYLFYGANIVVTALGGAIGVNLFVRKY